MIKYLYIIKSILVKNIIDIYIFCFGLISEKCFRKDPNFCIPNF